jgi:hypothetical protein
MFRPETRGMFVGHYGVSYAAKSIEPRLPLWVWFIAVQWMDVVWSVLVFLGVEKLHIVPGFTEANPYELYYMPYTHGLPGSIAISLVVGVIVAMFTSGDRAMTIFLVAAASFSHWLLDLIVHVPDLPLYDNTAKVGFGLWRHVALSFPLELMVLGLGAWLYARMTRFTSAKGQYWYWGFVAVLAVLQVSANFGPPPSSPENMAMTTLFLYVTLALLAAWIEHAAIAAPVARPMSSV